jgi:N-acetylneuraminic acid mutarotase
MATSSTQEVAMYKSSFRMMFHAGVLCLGLVGCGGAGSPPSDGPGPRPPGGNPPTSPPPSPQITEFSADKAAYAIGEQAALMVRFSGGEGRIDPDLGPVQSGVAVRTAALDGPRELRLVVESPSGAVTRTLRLPVDYRNDYRGTGQRFRSRGHSATVAGDGSVLLIGGTRGESTLSTSIDRYDPRNGALLKVGELSNGREGHRAVRLNDGRILVTGGLTALGLGDAELVDEGTGKVSRAGSPRVQRVSHTATRIGNDKVLVVGGYSAGEGAVLGISRSAEIWDPATNRFRLLDARMSVARAGHSATVLPDGRVLIVGGLSPDERYELAEVFDPATETFSVFAAVDNRERGLHATAQLPDGSVLVLGGETEQTQLLASVLQLSGGNGGTSRVLGNLLRPRTLVEGVVSRDGRVFLFGGEVGPGNATTETAEAYSASNGSAPIASLPGPRVGHTTTRLPDGRFLIAGGEDAQGALVADVLLYE